MRSSTRAIQQPFYFERLLAAVTAGTVGLAFWWGLTEPLPVPVVILLGVPVGMLVGCGVIAGRLGALAGACTLPFSLFLGSILATRLHQAFTPSSAPVSRFGDYLVLELPALLLPLALAALCGAFGGLIGERLLPVRRALGSGRTASRHHKRPGRLR